MVTWEHDDVKKVAIVASAHRGPDYGFSCFVTYATGSSSESEFLAIKEMLHTLQLKAAAFMSSIAMHETVVVLDHGLDIQRKVNVYNNNEFNKKPNLPIPDNMAVASGGKLITTTIEPPPKDKDGWYTDVCIDGIECKKMLRGLPGFADYSGCPHTIDRHS